MRKLSIAFLGLSLACGSAMQDGDGAAAGGTLVIATTTDPDILFPPLALTTQARQVNEQIYEQLAQTGIAMNTIGDSGFTPQLASSWTWSADSLSIAFQLHPGATWSDGTPARAADVAFTYSLYTDPEVASPVRTQLANIDSFTVFDSLTAVAWFAQRSPQQFYDAAAQMAILPRHVFQNVAADSLRAVAATIQPAGTGRYTLLEWKRGEYLELAARAQHYRGAASLQRLIWLSTPEFSSAVAKLLAGEADLFDALNRTNMEEVEKNPDITAVLLPGTDYAFLQFSLRDPLRRSSGHPLFASRELRRALTMAIDREALVRNAFDSLGQVAIGPTIRAFATTSPDLPVIPYDTARARAILDSLGWNGRDRDGIRTRNGRSLAFDMLVPVSSLTRMRMAVMIQEQLRRVGVRVKVEALEYTTFSAWQQEGKFDAALAAWHLGTTPTALRETWTTPRDGRKGLNYGSYSNPLFDGYVDSAIAARSLQESRRYFTRAYEIIIADAPAVWLYEPRTVIGIHSRIRPAPMRPDAWWINLGDWSIPPSERLARDRAVRPAR